MKVDTKERQDELGLWLHLHYTVDHLVGLQFSFNYYFMPNVSTNCLGEHGAWNNSNFKEKKMHLVITHAEKLNKKQVPGTQSSPRDKTFL